MEQRPEVEQRGEASPSDAWSWSMVPGEADGARREMKTGDLTYEKGARRMAAQPCEGAAAPEPGDLCCVRELDGAEEPQLLGWWCRRDFRDMFEASC
jgi:hypothetical protein